MASARQIRDEIMKMTIVVNSDPAQKAIYELNQNSKELTETNKSLSASLKEIESARKKEETAINNYADKIDKLKNKLHDEQSATINQIKNLTALQKQYSSTSKQYESYQIRIDNARSKSIANTKSLQSSINSLVAKQAKLNESYEKNTAEASKLSKELKVNKSIISQNKSEIDELTSSLDINQMTMQQLRKEAALLKNNLINLVPGSQQSQLLQSQLDKVNARMGEVRSGASGTSLSFKNLADRFNHYSGIVTACAGVLIGFGLTVQNIIDRNNKLIDAQTAVAKTVGMTTKEVQDLTKTFSDFDTRTSKIDLLKIAETGGRLGVQKSEIADFVQEVDKANVALGDGFAGGVEAVTNTLGKLKGLYSETKDLNIATAINQIGSAMNELGANGAASEQNIGEFAMRLGSLPEKLKPTIAEALALGAAFEEFGIDAERASTAYANVIRTAAKETDKFAKVMNLTKKEVDDMINKDPLEFFLKFAEGAKGLDTTELAKMLDYLKLNDQYVISTMGAASENTDKFRASIELSNKSLSEATSLQKEFDKVNNNSAAIYEKVQKQLAGIFANESVAKGLNFLIEGFGKMIGAVEDTDGAFKTIGQTIVFLTKLFVIGAVAVFSYNTAVALTNLTLQGAKDKLIGYTVIQKAHNLYTSISTTLQNLIRFAYLRTQVVLTGLTGNTMAQAAAQQRLNAITLQNPFALLVATLVVLAGALYLLKQRNDELAAAEKKRYEESHRLQTIDNQAKAEGVRAVEQYKNRIEVLINTMKSEISTKAQRKAAYEALIKIPPEFMGTVDSEFRATGKLIQVYKDLAAQVDATARAKARASARQSIYDEIEKNRIEYIRGQSAREKEQGERNKLRSEYGYSSERGNSAVNMFGSFEEHNKGVANLQAIANAEKLIKDMSAADQKRVAVLQNAIQTAKGNKRKVLEIELNSLLGIGEETNAETKSTYNIPDANADKDSKAKERGSEKLKRLQEQHDREMEKIAQDGEKAAQLARQIALDTEDAKIDAMQEGFEKEMAELNLQEQRRLATIDKQKIDETDIKNLQVKINKAKGQDKKLFQALMDSWLANNEALEKEKLAVAEVFEVKRETIQHNEALRKLKQEDENFQASLNLLKRHGNEKLVELKTIEDQKAFLQDKISADELAKLTTLEEGKAAIEKYYKEESLKRQVEFLKKKAAELSALVAIEAQFGVLDPNQVKTIEEYKNQIAALLVEIDQLKTGKTGKKDKDSLKGIGGETDILGLTPGQWETMFSNNDQLASGLDKARAGIVAMQNAFGLYFQFVEANQKRELQKFEQRTAAKKTAYKKQLLEGYINQETYKKLSLKADQDLDKKKAEMALKAAQRERQMQIMSIIGGTASAVVGALGNKPWTPANFVLAGIVGAIGAVQLATTLATPLPTADGYEDGYGMEYPIERAQDGKRFNVRRRRLSSGLVDRPTHFIAGENNKVEMVIDNPTWTSYPDELKRAIYSANARAKGFENGFNTVNTSKNKSSESSDDTMIMLISTVNRLSTTVDNLQKYGIEAKIAKTARNGKEVQDMQKMYDQLNNKNKHG